jgi:hypothetical protein
MIWEINEKNNVSDVKSNSNQVSNNNTNQNLEKSLIKKKCFRTFF